VKDTPGQIGPYRMEREIGRGGMGVVYLARDTTLDRDVAIKTLPDELSDDPERLSRFEREAKALASLNHSNIASIYGLEEVDGKRYLILEFVPGETLDGVLNHGPMPVSEALPVAKQIAEAIEAAHEKGIIHRDLKPANIKFAEGDQVKVLDFGLAKAFEEHTTTPSDTAASPTYIPTNTPTMPGVVLGTAGYLSPEQARGRAVDKRTDIFSFGCVLYEMLAGKMIFSGETATESLGATLHKEPQWDDLPPDTPPTILLLLRRCLTKDRKRRLHDIADARVEIEDAIADPTSSSLNLASSALVAAGTSSAKFNPLKIAAVLVVGVVLTAATTFAVLRALEPEPQPLPITRFSIRVPHAIPPWGQGLTISDDGRTAILPSEDGNFIRRMDRDELIAMPAAGSGDSDCSPDGRWIAYRGRGDLYRVSIDGGPPTKLTDIGFGFGIHWTTDGWIYISHMDEHRIVRVRETGGEPEVAASAEPAGEPGQTLTNLLFSPHAMPDGRTLLCTYAEDLAADKATDIRAYSLVDKSFKTIITDAAQPHYTSTGHLVFVRDKNLMAAPFDPDTLELTGPAVSIVEGLGQSVFLPIARYTLSANGTLLYTHASGVSERKGIVTFGPDGRPTPLVSFTRRALQDLRVSPDGRHLAVVGGSVDDRIEASIWLVDLARDIPALLTTESGFASEPLWSPGGSWVYYNRRSLSADEDDPAGIYRRRADFSGDAELVFASDRFNQLLCFDPAGKRLFGTGRVEAEPGGGTRFQSDILTLDLESDPPVIGTWLATPRNEAQIAVSPNGRWAAYLSTETGAYELYVRSIDGGQKHRISTEGARNEPFWSPSGDTLYYQVDADEGTVLHAVNITSGHEIAADGSETPPDTPFDWEPAGPVCTVPDNADDVRMHPNGTDFITLSPLEEDAERLDSFDVHVVLNLHEELKLRSPVEKRR
jgi:serine/threonine-protein kinase